MPSKPNKVKPRIRVPQPLCPFCKDTVRADEAKAACALCMAWHHEECWRELERCACCASSKPATSQSASAPGGPLTEPRSERVAPISASLPHTLELREAPGELSFSGVARHSPLDLLATSSAVMIDLALLAKLALGDSDLVLGASFGSFLSFVVFSALITAAHFLAVRSFFKHREVVVREHLLTVSTGPFYTHTVTIATSNLSQLHCQRNRPATEQGGDFSLIATPLVGSPRELASGLSVAEAYYLEKKLEAALGITNRPVPGEAFGL